MNEQLNIFNYLSPDYKGSGDEIIRAHIESQFEEMIILNECCGQKPLEYFKSCKEYFIKCPICQRRTRYFKHLYQAKQAWNKGESENVERSALKNGGMNYEV